MNNNKGGWVFAPESYIDLSPEMIVPYALDKGLIYFDDIPGEVAEEMKIKAETLK